MAASGIDRIGATLLFPFFSLYITQRFNVGMTEAGREFIKEALTQMGCADRAEEIKSVPIPLQAGSEGELG